MRAEVCGILGLCVLLSGPALGQLATTRPDQSIQALPADVHVVAVYPLTNGGSSPVAITAVDSGCDCLEMTLDRKTLNPGEQSMLTVTFPLGERTGEQHRTITVHTDDPVHPDLRLKLSVMIPQLLTVKPGLVYWKEGEPRTPKAVQLQVLEDSGLKLTKIQPSNAGVIAELKEVEPGRRYAVMVRPDPGATGVTVLTLQAELPDGTPRKYQVLARLFGPAKPVTAPATQPAGAAPALQP